MALLHPRISRWLALVLATVWVAAVASTDVVLTPGMHCHDMPCCPRSDGGMQSCSTAQCAEQVPERAENQNAAREPGRTSLLVTVQPATVAERWAASRKMEQTPGLRYTTPVFRLKDDLRI